MRSTGRRLCALAVLCYVPSWFLTAVHLPGDNVFGPTHGWDAFTRALDPIFMSVEGIGLPAIVWMVSSAASNVLLIAAMVRICWPEATVSRRLVWWLTAATALNGIWLLIPEMLPRLRVGYYLWLTAFVLGVLAGHAAVRERSATGRVGAGAA